MLRRDAKYRLRKMYRFFVEEEEERKIKYFSINREPEEEQKQ